LKLIDELEAEIKKLQVPPRKPRSKAKPVAEKSADEAWRDRLDDAVGEI
jgi:hypothetical protein